MCFYILFRELLASNNAWFVFFQYAEAIGAMIECETLASMSILVSEQPIETEALLCFVRRPLSFKL